MRKKGKPKKKPSLLSRIGKWWGKVTDSRDEMITDSKTDESTLDEMKTADAATRNVERSQKLDQNRIDYLVEWCEEGMKNQELIDQTVMTMVEEVKKHDDHRLYKTHALACIYAGNLNLAYCSLERIAGETDDKCKEVLGLVAHQMKRYKEAIKQFTGIEVRAQQASRISHSLALYYTKIKDPAKHQKILAKIVDKSLPANIILGTLYFNKGNYEQAEVHFKNAVEKIAALRQNPMLQMFNVLRCHYRKLSAISQKSDPEEYTQLISSFYADTGCHWTPEETEEKLQQLDLELPDMGSIPNTNLLKTVRSLLR